jgi:hypothetical protein
MRGPARLLGSSNTSGVEQRMMLYAFLALFVIGLLLGVRIMLLGVERPARTITRSARSTPPRASTEPAQRPAPRFALDLPTVAGFATASGATGYLLARYAPISPVVDAVIAAVAGAAGAIGAVTLVAAWAIPSAKAEVVDERYVFQGAFARVTGVTDRGTMGTIVYDGDGTTRTSAAKGLDGSPLEVGAEVVIERIEDGVAYVEPWARVEARL